MSNELGMFVFGMIMGVFGGVGIGLILAMRSFERYYQAIANVEEMLKRFKSEGNDDKWLE